MSDLMKVSSNPHIRSKATTGGIMGAVILALLPATFFGVYNFGLHALIVILVTVASTVLTEYIYELLMKKRVTVNDLSATVTGLLLALNLPPGAPLWLAGSRGRCVCDSRGKDAVWGTGTELYESGAGRPLFSADFLYFDYDEF